MESSYNFRYKLTLVDEELVVIIRDLMIGGAETVASLLEFAILHLALNPLVQQKLQSEIDRVTDGSRRALYSDRNRLVCAMAGRFCVLDFAMLLQ